MKQNGTLHDLILIVTSHNMLPKQWYSAQSATIINKIMRYCPVLRYFTPFNIDKFFSLLDHS